jgi:hypothetical protein
MFDPRMRTSPELPLRTVTEHIMFALDQAQFVTEIEISWIETVPGRDVGVRTSIPFAPLYQHRCVRDQYVSADMVEMEMRIYNEVDLSGITVDRCEPCTDLLAGREVDTEEPSHAFTETTGGIVLAIGR